MATLIHDQYVEKQLRAQRAESGADRWDEVWEGTYVMAPAPNDEHQQIVTRLSRPLLESIEDSQLGEVRVGINLSGRNEQWEHDYRIPDIAVFLQGTQAINQGTHWVGGPDFAIEIVSPNDKTREKLSFYAQIGTRELLIIDRDPWQLELYRLTDGQLTLTGKSDLAEPALLVSEFLPLRWCLLPGETRPRVEVLHAKDGRSWSI